MDNVRHIAVKPLSGILPNQAREARAYAWRFVFDCWQQNQRAAEHVPPPKNCDGHKRLVCE
jgi:hypothetical protein